MIVSKTEFILNASIQPKDGRLYLVYSHYDPIQKKTKPKWKAMGLPVDAKKSVIEKRKREMMRAFEEEEYRLREGWTDPSCYPLIEFLNEWADKNHSQKKIQSSTYASYKRNINGHIKLFFGEKVTLADCKPKLVNEFYDWLRNKGDSECTVLHYHNLLHAAFQYAIKQEIFEFNPLMRVDRPKAKKYKASYYSVEEVKTLESLAEDDPLYIPIILAAYCGVRRSEALGVTWDNVDFEKNEIHIHQKVVEILVDGKSQIIISDEMKNETSRRTIPMVPMVVEALKRHKARQEFHRQQFKDAYSTKYLNMVCVNAMGDLIKPNYVTTHFAYLLRKYGMRKIRFHDLRHTCASLLLASDNNMKVIQMWMGHSSMKTTADIYAHLDMSAKNTAAVALAHLFRLDDDDEAEE